MTDDMQRLLCYLLIMLTSACSMWGHDDAPFMAKYQKWFHLWTMRQPSPKKETKSKYGNKTYTVNGKAYHVLNSAEGYHKRGIASWYGTKFHGRKTSNHETYDMWGMTAASKELPLPTYVRVTNLNNHKQIIVRVNDRGPFHANRILDLSYGAALRLGMLGKGTAPVDVEAVTNKNQHQAIITTPSPSEAYIQVAHLKNEQSAKNYQKR